MTRPIRTRVSAALGAAVTLPGRRASKAIRSGRARIRTTILVLAAAALAAAGAVAVVPAASAQTGDSEYDGADCPVPQTPLTSNSQLPDPFLKLDGTRVSTVEQWRCRRAEIKEQAEQYVYGEKPIPDNVTGTVTNNSITVNVSDQGQSTSFSVSVSLPSGSGPFPAVIVLGGIGADTGTIQSAGAAIINYDPFAVGQEGTSRNNKQGAFYDIYGSSSSTGLLAAWAWGASRIIDVVDQSGGNILRADAMGVTGCSRFGKGAFVTGAFDQRIALTMPIESGSGGAPIFRGIPGEGGAQPLDRAYGEQPWLGDAFGQFTGNPNSLPVDTHEVVGMIAPRGLFIMENPHIDWLAAQSGAVAALGGAEIYRALGAEENISYWSEVQDGSHCASRPEWQGPLVSSINRFLLQSGSAPGEIRISPSKLGNLDQWRNWQTPILTTGGPTTPPATTPPSTPSTTPTTSSPPPPTGDCTASYEVVNEWNGGFQATVTVDAATPLNGWTVDWSFPNGQEIVQLWNGTPSTSGANVTVTNAPYNGTMTAGGSTTFGFVGSHNGTNQAPTDLTCTSA